MGMFFTIYAICFAVLFFITIVWLRILSNRSSARVRQAFDDFEKAVGKIFDEEKQ